MEEKAIMEFDQQHVEPGEWRQLLWDAVHASAPPHRFACSGRLEVPGLCPDVSVAGIGRLGLPLSKEQAASLRSVAKQAPHGRGSRTVVDRAVRDAFQVDALQVSIGGSWQPILESAVSHIVSMLAMEDIPCARATLDTDPMSPSADKSNDTQLTWNRSNSDACTIEARLYKLLLYEPGGHFIAHQDTEKERGMLGTLVVQLPIAEGHTGGSLTVRHKGEQFTHHFAEDSSSNLQYAAFFADCEHELSPITSGLRLVLVYNLVWVGAPAGAAPCDTPVPGRHLVTKSPAEVQLRCALQAWQQDIDRGGGHKSIALALEYKYTEANLSFNHLKGTDRAMVRALSTCEGLESHLVLVTRKTRNDFVEDTETVVFSTGKWTALDGSAIDYGELHPEEDFFDPGGNQLFDREDYADDEEWENYTGNEGTAVECVYRHALLVLWPRSQTLQNAKRAGFEAVLSVLKMRIREA